MDSEDIVNHGSKVMESRPFDRYYDPHFITGTSNKPLYRTIRKVEVLGADRTQFFSQPPRTYFHDVPLNIVLDPELLRETLDENQNTQNTKSNDYLNFREPPTKTIAIQTDYRDSECQTDPYTPDFEVIPSQSDPNKVPEVLKLANFSYAQGSLPVGVDEVERLERAKIKEEIIASLPNSGDKKCLELRRRVLEELEKRDWLYREWLLKKEQANRLQVIEEAIWKRDEEIQQDEDQRLDRYRVELHENYMRFRDSIQQRRIKELRKVSKTAQTWANFKQQTGRGGKQRDIIAEYANFGSYIYAPTKRSGSVPKQSTTKILRQAKRTVPSFAIPQEIEPSLQSSLSKPIQAPHNVTAPEYSTRVGAKILAQLDYLDSTMNVTRVVGEDKKSSRDGGPSSSSMSTSRTTKSGSPSKSSRNTMRQASTETAQSQQQPTSGSSLHTERSGGFDNMYKKFQPIVRPPTPKMDDVMGSQAEEEAIVMLQSLIRGCVVQNAMFEGKERQLELIQELRVRDAKANGMGGISVEEHVSVAEHESRLDTFLAGIIQSALSSSAE